MSFVDGVKAQKMIIFSEGKERDCNYNEVCKTLNVDGIIRVPNSEYENIDRELGYYGHFNLKETRHKLGKIYALLRILKPGSVDLTNGEIPPVLSLEDILCMKCCKVENNIPFDKLNDEYFRYSMKNVRDVEALKKVIFNRYGEVRQISYEDVMKLGVSFTLLKGT